MFVFIFAIKRVRVNYDDNINMKSDPINADYTSIIENKHIVTQCYEIFLYVFFWIKEMFFFVVFFLEFFF